MRLRRIALAASALAIAGCTAGGSTIAPAPTRTPQSPLTSGALLAGVYEGNNAAALPLIRTFGAATGTHPEIVLSYSGWWVPFDTAIANQEHASGATQLIQMDPQGVSLTMIVAGKYNAYLRSYAEAVKAFGHPVILGFGHEMNGTWYGWGKGRTKPAVFIAAWRHIVTLFRKAGASNVTWLWDVNSTNVARGSLQAWWPGTSWVGMVGVDGYYYFADDTFATVFGGTITQIRQFTSLPILIAETAVGPNPNAVRQISGLADGVTADHLRGLVWFDENQDDPPYHQAWKLTGSRLAAFREAVAQWGR